MKKEKTKPPILTLVPDQDSDHAGDNIRLKFKDVKKSGTQVITVGIGQDVHYWTADEIGTTTLGSQSFKYYLHPQFFVYDKVPVDISADFVLKKVSLTGGKTTVLTTTDSDPEPANVTDKLPKIQ